MTPSDQIRRGECGCLRKPQQGHWEILLGPKSTNKEIASPGNHPALCPGAHGHRWGAARGGHGMDFEARAALHGSFIRPVVGDLARPILMAPMGRGGYRKNWGSRSSQSTTVKNSIVEKNTHILEYNRAHH